ncbi:MAG: hypothetical protein ABJF50_07440 [Paracoccaceae bacterium]
MQKELVAEILGNSYWLLVAQWQFWNKVRDCLLPALFAVSDRGDFGRRNWTMHTAIRFDVTVQSFFRRATFSKSGTVF